ncbi:MAG: NUDIX hydrolase [Anaerolineae bacterium]|nr:NUDIX hydrolase [Anaerolineae bacterium]
MRPPANFCQVCGHSLEDRPVHGRVRRVCPACGFVHFEDPKVAVAAFIEDGGRVLLVRRAFNPERGKWALPAGYVDYGEDPAAAAIREVKEETGLDIAIAGVLGVSGGSGQFGASIVITYAATVLDGVARPADDADAVLWLSPGDALPDIAFTSTRQALAAWQQRGKQHFGADSR